MSKTSFACGINIFYALDKQSLLYVVEKCYSISKLHQSVKWVWIHFSYSFINYNVYVNFHYNSLQEIDFQTTEEGLGLWQQYAN